MAATTTQLGLVTPTQGTLSGTWGDTVNNGITEYVNIAIAGTLSFAGDGAITLANTTGGASASNIGSTTAQYAVIRVTGTLTTTKVITGPTYSKLYMVENAATGGTVTFKTSGLTGVSIAVGERCFVYCNGDVGSDYVKVASSVVDGVSTISFGSTGLTPATATSGAVTVAGILAVANGGNGTATPTLTQGANVTITGTWPNYTIAAANPGTGTVTGVTASSPLASSGGANPNISLASSTGSGAVVLATSPTLVTPLLGTPTSGNLANCTFPTLNQNTTGTAASTPLLQTTNFSISESGGKLIFKYGATTIASMDSSGNLITVANVTAYGTP